MANDSSVGGDKKKMHSDYINRMKKDRVKWRMKELQGRISEAEREGDQPKLEILLMEYNRLVKEVTL
jgi:uncharacterized membrane protein (DUF106 family)